MELIRRTKTIITKNGNKIRYAIFWCNYCKQEVERDISSGKKQKSCGCMNSFFTSKYNKKRIYTEKTKQKISKSARERFQNPKNHPLYGKLGIFNPRYGQKHTEIAKQKISEACRLEKHWNWQNGKSFEPYSPEFNKEKKTQVLERDNYKCQNPNCEHLSEGLDVHHIDYNKQNNSLDNLTTLCDSCHTKTNFNRQYWIDYYSKIMEINL